MKTEPNLIPDKDKLIYDLMYSKKINFTILVNEYIVDAYKYDYFLEEIKDILQKSKVIIIKESLSVSTEEIRWKIKVNRK